MFLYFQEKMDIKQLLWRLMLAKFFLYSSLGTNIVDSAACSMDITVEITVEIKSNTSLRRTGHVEEPDCESLVRAMCVPELISTVSLSDFKQELCDGVYMTGIDDKPIRSIQVLWNATVMEKHFVYSCNYFKDPHSFTYTLRGICHSADYTGMLMLLILDFDCKFCEGFEELICDEDYPLLYPRSTEPCFNGASEVPDELTVLSTDETIVHVKFGTTDNNTTTVSTTTDINNATDSKASEVPDELTVLPTDETIVHVNYGTTDNNTTTVSTTTDINNATDIKASEVPNKLTVLRTDAAIVHVNYGTTDNGTKTVSTTTAINKATDNPIPTANHTKSTTTVSTTTNLLSPSPPCSVVHPALKCHVEPCSNGVCENYDGTVNCSCDPGFIGNECDCDIDECASNPCKEGKTCYDQPNGYTCDYSPNASGLSIRDICIVVGVALAVLAIPLMVVLHKYYQTKRKLQASRRAYQTEHEIVDRMSSAHFSNPAYQSDKDIHGKLATKNKTPPPISPRPIISLPAGSNGNGNDIYAEYIYIDRPEARASSHLSSSHKDDKPDKSLAEGDATCSGEYIYVVDCARDTGNAYAIDKSGAKVACPKLPSIPPPSPGEYIYFDQSESSKSHTGSEEYIYVDEPTQVKSTGKALAVDPTQPGTPSKPAPPIACVRPLPLEPPSTPANMTKDDDDKIKEMENLYEELPEGKGNMSIDVDTELDNDIYLEPANITA